MLNCSRRSTIVQSLLLPVNTSDWQGNKATKATDFSRSFKNLNDFQKLLRDINWARPQLGIAIYQLKPSYNTLQGDPASDFPSSLSTEAQKELALVEKIL